MHDARDAEDKRLLAEGEHKLLLASYFHQVRERCYLRSATGTRPTTWPKPCSSASSRSSARARPTATPRSGRRLEGHRLDLKGFYPRAKQDGTLPDDWDAEAPDAFADWEGDEDLLAVIADLPPAQREVVDLLYRDQLSHEQIAERLGKTRNAVDQALHNAHKNLAEKLRG